jgi:hypothetical protein
VTQAGGDGQFVQPVLGAVLASAGSFANHADIKRWGQTLLPLTEIPSSN